MHGKGNVQKAQQGLREGKIGNGNSYWIMRKVMETMEEIIKDNNQSLPRMRALEENKKRNLSNLFPSNEI